MVPFRPPSALLPRVGAYSHPHLGRAVGVALLGASLQPLRGPLSFTLSQAPDLLRFKATF